MSDLNIALILRFVDQATAPARAAMQNLQGAAEAVQRYGNQQMAAGRQMVEVADQQTAALRGSTLATVGTGVALFAALKPAVDFEAQMDRVAAVSQLSAEQQKSLTRAALEQGARTKYSALQAAEALEAMGMAGFSAERQSAALPGVLDLAAAANSDLGQTASHAANMLNSFQLPAEQMGRIGDVLVNTFTSADVRLEDLALTMSYAAPEAKRLGIEIETVAAMSGLLGDTGLKGERSGTALRAVFQRLVAPSAEAARALEAVGVNVADAEGNIRPLLDVLADMDEAMGKMPQATREHMRSVIFGTEAAGAAATLMEAAGNGSLQAYAERLGKVGSAARVASEMIDNTRGDIEQLSGAAETSQIALGWGLLPVLSEIAAQIEPIAVAVGVWAEANQPLVTTIGWIVVGLLGLNVAVLAAQWGFWLLFGWVGKARMAFGALLAAAGWIGRGLAALALRALPLVKIALLGVGNILLFVARGIVGAGMALARLPLVLAIRALTLGPGILMLGILALALAVAGAVKMIYDSWDNIVAYFQDKFVWVACARSGPSSTSSP